MEALQQTAAPARGPKFNALKHGLYPGAALLPGEDTAEFRHQQLQLYYTFRPQTVPEAVERLVEAVWQRQRYRPMQSAADAQAQSAGHDAAGRSCEPATHKRLHSSMDVSVQRARVDIAEARAMSKLMQQQRLRRQGLVAGAVALPSDCYMDANGVVRGPIPAPVIVPVPEVRAPEATVLESEMEAAEVSCQVPPTPGTTDSVDGGNFENLKQQENGAAATRAAAPVTPETGAETTPDIAPPAQHHAVVVPLGERMVLAWPRERAAPLSVAACPGWGLPSTVPSSAGWPG